MSIIKTLPRRKSRRKRESLCDFLSELYEDIIPAREDTPAISRRKHKNVQSNIPSGHFFPPNSSAKALTLLIKNSCI